MAGVFDFVIEQGADFAYTLTWTSGSPLAAVNLTGYHAKMEIRDGYSDGTGASAQNLGLLATYADVGGSPAAAITLGGAAGTIALLVPGATTATYDFWRAPMRYDLLMTSPGGVLTRLIEGTITLLRSVTT